MPSSQTTRNRLEKQASGENANTWGDRFNSNFADLADTSLDGMTSFTLSGLKTLTANNYAADESRARYLNITSGTGGTVTIPNVEKSYLVRNATSGTVTFTTGSGTTADVAAGIIGWIVCEGGNIVRAATSYQTVDSLLTSIAGLTFGADNYIYGTGSDTAAVGTITSFGRSLVDDADATAAKVTLGLVIGTNVQAYDAELAAIAGLTSAADKGIQFTGSGTAATYDLTTAGKALLDDASATAQRTTLGLGTVATLDETTAAQFRANTADKVLSTDQVWSAADYVALTDAATVAVDMSLGFNFTLTLGGNRTLGAPTNMKAGQTGLIEITQDGTGTRTLAYNAAWRFANATDPVLTTTAGAKDLLFYQVLPGATTVFGNLLKAIG
jgi:hypothetical protein